MAAQRSHPLLSIACCVVLPVLILHRCSAAGEAWYELGATPALAVALSLPLGYGLWSLLSRSGGGFITLLGILTTLLTGAVTIFAQTGEGEALRPGTPWLYAAKEAALPLVVGVLFLITGTEAQRGSMLRIFFYTEELFHTREVETRVAEQHREADYRALLGLVNCLLAGTFFASAVLNLLISLHFQLPVLELPAAQQAEAYNYAVGSITWWSWLIISFPALVVIIGLALYLPRKLKQLTGEK